VQPQTHYGQAVRLPQNPTHHQNDTPCCITALPLKSPAHTYENRASSACTQHICVSPAPQVCSSIPTHLCKAPSPLPSHKTHNGQVPRLAHNPSLHQHITPGLLPMCCGAQHTHA
jgi:hypothetical protein